MPALHMLTAQSIAGRLTRWFLVIGLVPLGLTLFVADRTFARAMKREIENNLVAIAGNKANYIRAYALERERDVTKLAQDPTIVAACTRLLQADEVGGRDSAEYGAAEAECRPFLTYYRERSGYANVLLLSPAGETLFSVRDQDGEDADSRGAADRDSELAQVFIRATTLLATEISRFDRYPATGEPAAFVAAPVLRRGDVVGVVALQMGGRELNDLAADYVGLGQTGELLLGTKLHDHAVFVTPVRHDARAAFNRRLPLAAPAAAGSPLCEAVQGRHGHGLAMDYRGRKVLAAWRYLPHFDGGMVTKIDTVEAFAPVSRLRVLFWSVAVLTCGAIVIVALAEARNISQPIRLLQAGTEAIGSGDLGHKVGTAAQDEIGQLSRAFDHMAENLSRITASRDELDQTRRELERSNKELEQFAYVASHDLQEPLRKICAFGDLLATECGSALTGEAKDYLERMLNAAKRMQSLINDLLALSRVSTRAQPFVPVDLNQTLADVLSDLESRTVAAAARVEVSLLPTVEADPIQMHQLFQNLVGNAIKFHRPDEPPLVKVFAGTTPADAAETEVVVEDNGIGFDEKYAERIFGIFQRLHNRSTYEGTGIGLAVCRKIVARHGGSISAHSQPGAGARFVVGLPRQHAGPQKQGETA